MMEIIISENDDNDGHSSEFYKHTDLKCILLLEFLAEKRSDIIDLLWFDYITMKRRLLIQKNNRQIVRSVTYQQIRKTFNVTW